MIYFTGETGVVGANYTGKHTFDAYAKVGIRDREISREHDLHEAKLRDIKTSK